MADDGLNLQYTANGGDMDVEIITNIEGPDELEKALIEGSPRAVKKYIRKVEMTAAQVLVDSAKKYAPFEFGTLEDDIHRQTVMGDGVMIVRVGPSKETFWGLIQEFGSPEANVPALHWLEDLAKARQDEVLETYIEAVNEGLEEMKK